MNNYRKYWMKFEERENKTTVELRECNCEFSFDGFRLEKKVETIATYNYTKLIDLVHEHTEIPKEEITWEICFKWLLEEVQEKIKLKKFEYDWIVTNDQPHSRKFNSFSSYRHMMEKGYFKGLIGNDDKSLKWILEHCEVVEDD